MKLATYSRVSTDLQEQDGTSLLTQAAACRDYAEKHGHIIVTEESDTASGFDMDRPGLTRLRDLARRKQLDLLVCYALDRLSRKQTHVAILFDEMERFGVRVEFVTESFEDTATGQFLRGAKAFAAELEREKIRERTVRGKLARAREGRLPQGQGAGLYGYRLVLKTDGRGLSYGRREVIDTEARIVNRIFSEFTAGASCAGIASRLNRDCVPSKAGKTWHPLTVRRLLLNAAYTGTTVFNQTRTVTVRDPDTGKKRQRRIARDEADHIQLPEATPRIISDEMFQRAQEIFADPERAMRGSRKSEYELTGRLRCLTCRTPMVGQSLGGGRYLYYRCRKAFSGDFEGATCRSRYVRADVLELAVRKAVASVIADPERVAREIRHLRNEAISESETARLERELAQVRNRQRRLVDALADGNLPAELVQQRAAELAKEAARIETAISRVRRDEAAEARLDAMLDRLPQIARALSRWVTSVEGDEHRLLMEALEIRVHASTEKAEISGTIPDLETDQVDELLVTTARTSA